MWCRSNQVIKRSFLHQSPAQTWPRACHTNRVETKKRSRQNWQSAQTVAHFKGRNSLSLVIIRRQTPETQRKTKVSREKSLRTYHREAGSKRREAVCLKEIKEKERNRLILGKFCNFPRVKPKKLSSNKRQILTLVFF